MIYPRECSMCAWEECLFCSCWMACSVWLLGSYNIKYSSRPVFPCWDYMDDLVIHYWKLDTEVPYCYSTIVIPLFRPISIYLDIFNICLIYLNTPIYMLNIFRYSNVECLCIFYSVSSFDELTPLSKYNDICLLLQVLT